MAKTTLPSKQLELPIMVDLNQRGERPISSDRLDPPAPSIQQPFAPRRVVEASAVDLSVYDAISSNYTRGSK
jgi:hypothetical protein